jgi:nucleotide-binding universal stress UspA family protein
MYDRILLPTDGAAGSAVATEEALDPAELSGGAATAAEARDVPGTTPCRRTKPAPTPVPQRVDWPPASRQH